MILRDNYVNNIYLLNMTRKQMSDLFWLPNQSNPSLMEQRSSVHLLLQLLIEATVLMHRKLLHATVKMGVLRLKIFILISYKFQWHMMTPSESTLTSRLCIDSLSEFWISVMNSRIKIYPFTKESVLVHHLII